MDDLRSFVTSVTGRDPSRVEERLADGFVRLAVSEAERRQAAHDVRWIEDALLEMLRNSRDAGAKTVYVATKASGDVRSLWILDDGEGIPASMHERVFLARVTSRLETFHEDEWGMHGRGMALFAIRSRALEAGVVRSIPGEGTVMRVLFDRNAIKERADQSGLPSLASKGEYPELMPGPRNLMRTVAEVALANPSMRFYMGTPAEIVATIRHRMQASDRLSSYLFATEDAGTLYEGLGLAADGPDLAREAARLGIPLSDRTAQRIISGDVAPLSSVREQLLERHGAEASLDDDLRGLKITRRDREDLALRMADAFGELAERYYLELRDMPRIKVTRDRITVTFDVLKM